MNPNNLNTANEETNETNAWDTLTEEPNEVTSAGIEDTGEEGTGDENTGDENTSDFSNYNVWVPDNEVTSAGSEIDEIDVVTGDENTGNYNIGTGDEGGMETPPTDTEA